VIGADGRLTGYAHGVEMKRHLLELEGVSFHTTEKAIAVGENKENLQAVLS